MSNFYPVCLKQPSNILVVFRELCKRHPIFGYLIRPFRELQTANWIPDVSNDCAYVTRRRSAYAAARKSQTPPTLLLPMDPNT
ncbi:hypothetical protein EVAR_6289_1 [Eumeta japonica]|uniref:Uncharacterized protein n=1 Tax=Eumeta variegata TaxID=151549 RepID=A0A4C1T8I8_EUMVA|nr:hypothetical protein EVAR_6289_1 [Eumeta japonica]